MDGEGSRKKSRRRSSRILKCGKAAADDKENVTRELYGSVWMAESDKYQSPSHDKDHRVQSDSLNENQGVQSDFQAESGQVWSDNQWKSENIQACYGSEAGKFNISHYSESDKNKSCGKDSANFQSSVHDESEKIPFSLIENTDNTNNASQESEKHRHKKKGKHQSSFLCDSSTVQFTGEDNHHRFIHGHPNKKAVSPGLRFYEESTEIHTPCRDESDMKQAPHPSFQVGSDNSMHVLQHTVQDESKTDRPSNHGESLRVQSPCDYIVNDQLQDHCQSEQASLQLPDDSKVDSKIQNLCHSEHSQSWSFSQDTPETLRCAPAVLHTSSASLREATLCASGTPHTFYKASKQAEKTSFCTTPVWNDSRSGIDSETSLDKGFWQTEESPFALEKSSDTSSDRAISVQEEDSVSSPRDGDSPNTIKTLVVNTACGSAPTLPSDVHVTSSFLYTPVSWMKSQAVGDRSYLDTSTTSLISSAERPDSAMTSASACPVTTTVAPVQRRSIGGFCCTPVGRMETHENKWSANSGADGSVEAAENIKTQADRPVVSDIRHSPAPTDQSECDSNETQSVFMDADITKQSVVLGVSTPQSATTASELFMSGRSSQNRENHLFVHTETDTVDCDQLASSTDKTGSKAIVRMPAEKGSECSDIYQTFTAHSAETLHKSFDREPASLTWPQHSPSDFLGSKDKRESTAKQGEEESKDSKKKRKNRRRSAFGAELRLDAAVDISVPTLQPEQCESVDPACDEAHRMFLVSELDQMHLPAETVHKMFTPHKSDQNSEVEANDHCEEIQHHQESPTTEDSSRRVRSRRKRRSADWSIRGSGSADSQDMQSTTDADSETLLFRKRRSSLRLYRQQYQRPSTLATTTEDSGTSTKEPQAGAMDSEFSSHHQEGSADSCEAAELNYDTVPSDLEQLYKNKNYKKPADKTWETIFEKPFRGKDVSKQKLKRYIQFEDHVSLPKLKRRLKKAVQNGWDIEAVANDNNREEVVKKLQRLDEDLSQMDD